MMINNEEWKRYKFGKDFDTDESQLLFSRFGEVLSITKANPKGRLLKGSLREGYPIISFSKQRKMDEKTKQFFEEKENAITELRKKINELKKIIKRKKTDYKNLIKAKKSLATEEKNLKKLLDQISKLRKKDSKKRRVYFHLLVHKAVAELFIPNDDPQNKKYVVHKNFIKTDNRVENLAWATKEEVIKRSFESPKYIQYKITKKRRDPSISSKLTYNDVVFIKRKLQKGEPMSRLARRFGVSDMQIYRIKTGENWGDVKISLSKK